MSLVLLQANARIDAPKRASDWRASPCRLHVAVPQNPQPALVGTTGAKSVRRCAQTDLETQITASVSWRLPSRQLLRVQSTSGHDASRPIDLRRGRPHRVPLSRSRDAAGSSPRSRKATLHPTSQFQPRDADVESFRCCQAPGNWWGERLLVSRGPTQTPSTTPSRAGIKELFTNSFALERGFGG
jgi:hypothetical protein